MKNNLQKTDSGSTRTPVPTFLETDTPNFEQADYSSGDLGKIEKILFGRHIESSQRQLLELHSYIEKALSKLVDNHKLNIDALNVKFDQKLAEFGQSLNILDAQHREQAKLTDDVQQNMSSQLEKIAANSDQLRQDLKSEISSSNESLTTQIQCSNEDMTERLNSAIHSLSNQKLDRDSLSTLLNDVAQQLTGSANDPGVRVNNSKDSQQRKG